MHDGIYRTVRYADHVALYFETGTCNAPVDTYRHVVNHSPDGFEFGYNGSGPAQLALAILCHHTQDNRLADRLHQQYKAEVIAQLERGAPGQIHEIPAAEVARWVKQQQELTP